MPITAETLRSAEDGLLKLDRAVGSLRASLQPPVSCYHIEETIRLTLPVLKQVVSEVLDAWSRGAGTGTVTVDRLTSLTRVGSMIPVLRSRVLEALREFLDASCSPEVASEYRACLISIDSLLRPIEMDLYAVLFPFTSPIPVVSTGNPGPNPLVDGERFESVPDPAWAGDPIGWALEQMSRTRRGTPVEVIPGPPRLPGPFFETGEMSAPFDLPRLGPKTRVTPIFCGPRLAQPHDISEGA